MSGETLLQRWIACYNSTLFQQGNDVETTLGQRWNDIEQRWIHADVNVVISTYIQRQ